MQNKRYILCGKVAYDVPEDYQETALSYHLTGNDEHPRKVTLEIDDFRRSLFREIPDRLHDLLEIAAYVYCADQEVVRGQRDTETFGSNWRRHFHFVIPVCDVAFWQKAETISYLAQTLGFLSDDKYEFEFVEQKERVSFQQCFNFNEKGEMFKFPEQVIMFSGGLDSLGGAIEEIINQKKRVVLVNHRSTGKLDPHYRELERMLKDKAPDSCKPSHIRITVNKRKEMNKEYTQRSRSFLFVCIGATIAEMLGLNSVRFYENGIISLNLPICAQVVGGRATRTTHPRVINGFHKLLSMVAGKPFTVENPFIDKTKGEVVELIGKAGCKDLIGSSISCTHTWEMTREHSHCGTCSQCIDRRFAVIAAGLEQHDPIGHYKYDVFIQSRENEDHQAEDKTMFAGYLERANQSHKIKDCVEFLVKYPEAARALEYLPGDPWQVADRIFAMYKRHSKEVNSVVETMLARHSKAIRQRTSSANSMIRIINESRLPISVSSVSAVQETLPDNVFRRKGQAWQVRYNGGKDFIILPTKGAEYLCSLLAKPNEEIPIVELVCGATIDHCNHLVETQDAIDNGLRISTNNPIFKSVGKVADWPALRDYRDELAQRQADLERAKDENDSIEILQCEQDIAITLGLINETIGAGKNLKDALNKKKNLIDSSRKATKSVIGKIGDTDKAFAEHLNESFPLYGALPAYRPKNSIKWEIRPISNI